jgi:SAM-dependent methyltransferase
MSLSVLLRRSLADPRLAGVDYDGDELAVVHRRILSEKPLMRAVFTEFYRACRSLDAQYFSGPGLRVELGAGVSLLKEVYPDVWCTDVKGTSSVDVVVDAQAMPFAAASVRAMYAINCFHHFPQPERFFAELECVLAPGGGCVIIEPYHGPVARWFYRRLFDTETFDPDAPGWGNADAGIMKGANQALSYIVFDRDVDRFRADHPRLELVYSAPLRNQVRYLLSGGLNFRQLVPTFLAPVLVGAEALLSPLAPILSLHHVVVLRKNASTGAPPRK